MNTTDTTNDLSTTPKDLVDPVTLEIVRSSMVMTAEQINARIIRSAMNVVVKEMQDCSAAVFDGQGRLLAESASVPIHLGAIGLTLRTVIDHYLPLSEWNEGDVVLINDPFAGEGSLSTHHTNDVIVYAPIFWETELVAITALTVHHVDLGSMWMACRGWGVEIEQEGIRFPPVKIVKKGVLDEQLVSIMVNNSRLKASLDNDLRAQIYSVTLGKPDIARMFERYGSQTMKACFDELIDYSERRTRQEIERFKDGVYTHEEYVLEDGAMGGPYKLAIKITVSGDEVECDFSGTDPQIRGPINATLSATYAATFYVMRCVTDPTIPNTEGSRRPIRVIAPAGSMVNAQWPAAVQQRMVVCHSIVDLIMGALEKCAPERVMGDSIGCSYNEIIATDLMTGTRVHFGEVSPGGLGGTAVRDGASALSCHVTNCPLPPIEVNEIENPVLYTQREFLADSGGAGKQRGGTGIVLSYKVLTDHPQLSFTSQKSKIPPQGVAGGQPGKSGAWFVNAGKPEEFKLEYSMGDLIPIKKGDIVTQYTNGGGGYGNPSDRDIAAIVGDIREGLVTVEGAERDYGVKIDRSMLA